MKGLPIHIGFSRNQKCEILNELKREKQRQQIALFLKFSSVYARPQPPHKERIHGLKIDASEFFSLGQMVIETMLDFEHVFLLIVLGTKHGHSKGLERAHKTNTFFYILIEKSFVFFKTNKKFSSRGKCSNCVSFLNYSFIS